MCFSVMCLAQRQTTSVLLKCIPHSLWPLCSLPQGGSDALKVWNPFPQLSVLCPPGKEGAFIPLALALFHSLGHARRGRNPKRSDTSAFMGVLAMQVDTAFWGLFDKKYKTFSMSSGLESMKGGFISWAAWMSWDVFPESSLRWKTEAYRNPLS